MENNAVTQNDSTINDSTQVDVLKQLPVPYPLPKKVAILFTDAKREYFTTEALYITEKDAEKEANLIAEYIKKMGMECETFPADSSLIDNLRSYSPEMVFNLVYSVKGTDYDAATIPAILDFLEIPYTGADFFGYAFNTDKYLVNVALQQGGVPVPNFQLFQTPNDVINLNLRYPLISKLNETHCAVEITKDAISENEKHLRERLKYLITTYKQPVLVEEFIAGREITAILLEGMNKKVYFGEKVFTNTTDKYIFTTFDDIWVNDTASVFKYEKFDDPTLREYVKKAFETSRMYDYAKFDIRMDQSGRYFFIDANCNPAFGPKIMEVAISSILDMYGINFTEIIRRIIVNTLYHDPQSGNGNGNGTASSDPQELTVSNGGAYGSVPNKSSFYKNH